MRDVEKVRLFLADESKAVDEYQEWINTTGDESLKVILQSIREDEKRHVKMLSGWLGLEAEIRHDVERIFEEKKHRLYVEARLELGFLDHVPIVGKNVYGEAFPFEKPPRVRIEVFAPDATTQEITEIVCEELLHVKHPEFSEMKIKRLVPGCMSGRLVEHV